MIIVTFPLPSSITPLDRRHSLVLFSSVLRLRCYFPEAKRLVHVGGVGDWGESALGEAGGKVGAETQCLAVCSAPTPLGCGQEYQATLFQRVCVPATSSGWAGVLNRQRAHLVLLEACQYPDTVLGTSSRPQLPNAYNVAVRQSQEYLPYSHSLYLASQGTLPAPGDLRLCSVAAAKCR